MMLTVRELPGANSVEEVLSILRTGARTLTGARGVTVVARDGDFCHYLADDAESPLWPGQRFPMERCVSGWAMLNGAPAVVEDIFADERIPQEAYRPTYVRSLIMIPIGEGRPYAAFGVYWDRVRQHAEADVELLSALGSCAACALERISLVDQVKGGLDRPEERDLLEKMLDPHSLLKEREGQLADAHRRLNAILDNATVAIFLMDEKQQCVYMNAAAEKLTGYTLDETVGRPLHDVVHHTHPDGRPYPLEECPIDRAFPERARMQGEETFVHKDGRFYPVFYTASPILDESARTVGTIIEVQDIAGRKAAEAQRQLLVREVDHRARNMLAVVQSMIRLTRSGDIDQFKKSLGGRVDAMARAQSSLASANWQGASLRELVANELRPFTELDRVHMQCEDLVLPAGHVQPICMILHELATNAVKHGALLSPSGRIEVNWQEARGHLNLLCWREVGGPPVTAPMGKMSGFGSTLLHRLAEQLEGRMEFHWHAEGLEAVLRFGVADAPADKAS